MPLAEALRLRAATAIATAARATFSRVLGGGGGHGADGGRSRLLDAAAAPLSGRRFSQRAVLTRPVEYPASALRQSRAARSERGRPDSHAFEQRERLLDLRTDREYDVLYA